MFAQAFDEAMLEIDTMRKRIAELEAQMRTWLSDYAGPNANVVPVPRYQIENLLNR